MLKGLLCISAAAAFVMTPNALAQSITMTDLGTNQAVGTVELSESDYGIVFTPNLSGIPAGLHGFHVHTNPSCDSAEKDGKP